MKVDRILPIGVVNQVSSDPAWPTTGAEFTYRHIRPESIDRRKERVLTEDNVYKSIQGVGCVHI